MRYFALIFALLFSIQAVFAQNRAANPNTAFNLNPRGIAGSAGAGVVLFDIKEPNSDFSMDQGLYGAISGERGMGFMHLWLTISLGYLQTEGQSFYDYSTLSGDNYTGTDVPFQTQVFQGGLGLKFKLLQNSWIRPYVEGGGLAGYFRMNYRDVANRVSGPGNDAKTSDALLDFGYYYEGGLEISFSEQFGIRIAARFTENQTKEFETLGNQKVEYSSEVYYLSVLTQF